MLVHQNRWSQKIDVLGDCASAPSDQATAGQTRFRLNFQQRAWAGLSLPPWRTALVSASRPTNRLPISLPHLVPVRDLHRDVIMRPHVFAQWPQVIGPRIKSASIKSRIPAHGSYLVRFESLNQISDLFRARVIRWTNKEIKAARSGKREVVEIPVNGLPVKHPRGLRDRSPDRLLRCGGSTGAGTSADI